MEKINWSECPLVEVIPGKVSGAPVLKNTRLPVDAITGNYEAFRDQGLSPDQAIAETLDCYPEVELDAIKAILRYRAEHSLQTQDQVRFVAGVEKGLAQADSGDLVDHKDLVARINQLFEP
jgi:uncharacterized protein (DUF433 family)